LTGLALLWRFERKPLSGRAARTIAQNFSAGTGRIEGVKVPEKVGKGRIKNSNYMIKDPDNHLIEVVQYEQPQSDSRPGLL